MPTRARRVVVASDAPACAPDDGGEAPSGMVGAPAAVRRTPRSKPADGVGMNRSQVPKILERAALDLFARQNYSAVTIKDIATATGVNASLIYYYFGSKEELFRHVVEMTAQDALEKFELIGKGSGTPEETIENWIDIHVTHFVLMQILAKISLDYSTSRSRSAPLDRAIRRFYDKESKILSAAIRRGVREGRFRPVDPASMSTFISTFLDGALFRQVMFPTFDFDAAIRNMSEITLGHLRRS